MKNNTKNKIAYHHIFLLLIFFIFAGCSYISVERDSAPDADIDISSISDAIPKLETRSKYGNPESYVVFGKRYYLINSNKGFTQQGIASWYGKKFHGKRTSNGETYNMYAMTAAHKTIILPAYVEITNLENNKKIIVRANDRGPFHENRIIDLSYSAAVKLDIVAKGTGLVEIRVVSPEDTSRRVSRKRNTPTETYHPDRLLRDFYIQVAAFSELDNAKKLRKKLNAIGSALIKINHVVIDSRSFYRVRIGPLSNIENADNIVQQLIQLDEHDHHIVFN